MTHNDDPTTPFDIPAPKGQHLAITIECTTAPGERFGTPHRVTIHPDWSVTIPHDIDAEQIARSLGSWNSCLHFIERIVPAYRGALAAMSSLAPLPRDEDRMRYELDAEYRLGGATGFGPGNGDFAVTEHRLYRELLERAGGIWAAWGDPRYMVGGSSGYRDVWRDGITPVAVDAIARMLPRDSWPLPADFFRRVYFERIDLTWLVTIMNCYPTSEVAMWATELGDSAARRYPADALWRFYDLGVGDRDAIAALDAGIAVEAVNDLAARPGVSGTTAVRWLTTWARVGAMPTVDHYRLLDEHRVLLDRPPQWLVDWTVLALRNFGRDPLPRTELAVMLALTSDVNVVREAVRLGVTTARDIRFIRLIKQRNPNQ